VERKHSTKRARRKEAPNEEVEPDRNEAVGEALLQKQIQVEGLEVDGDRIITITMEAGAEADREDEMIPTWAILEVLTLPFKSIYGTVLRCCSCKEKKSCFSRPLERVCNSSTHL
jgi:hypothetical protein